MKKIDSQKIYWPEIINVLKKNGVIVFPTDTAYGLAADFSAKPALKKIFLIKNRPPEKKIALVAGDLAQVKKYFKLNSLELKLARKYWPGPLTLILRMKDRNKRVGVRVPKYKVARQMCLFFGKPLTATSANISGQKTPYRLADALRQFKKHKPDLAIDGGPLKKVIPSTIARIDRHKIIMIREGSIKL